MKWLQLFKANFRKELINLKRYLPNTISEIITFYAIFLGMFFGIEVIGDPSKADMNVQYTIVNYVFWFLSMNAMQGIGWVVMSEAQLGTLEQLYMSPMGAWRILLTRIISSTIIQLGIIIILLFLSMLTTGTWLNVDVLSIMPILVFIIVGMIGISFMVAGMAIIIKQISSFLQVFQFILAALTFVPLSVSPYLAIAPITKGIDMVRAIMIYNRGLGDFPLSDYSLLIGNGVFYFILGILVFKRCESVAMEKGVLGQY